MAAVSDLWAFRLFYYGRPQDYYMRTYGDTTTTLLIQDLAYYTGLVDWSPGGPAVAQHARGSSPTPHPCGGSALRDGTGRGVAQGPHAPRRQSFVPTATQAFCQQSKRLRRAGRALPTATSGESRPLLSLLSTLGLQECTLGAQYYTGEVSVACFRASGAWTLHAASCF